MTFSNGNSTKFFYSAEGEKLRAVHTTGGTTTKVDYCGNIVYEAGNQKYLLNQEVYYEKGEAHSFNITVSLPFFANITIQRVDY